MAKAIASFISAFALLFVGLGAGVWWEHRPAGWPNWRLGLGPIHWTLRLPDSLGARYAILQAAQAAAAKKSAVIVISQQRISEAAGLRQRQVQARIEIQTRTLIKEIPIYVTRETDARFPLPVGLVRLHDAAARGLVVSAVPDPAGRADDAVSDVAASDLAAVFGENYGACRADGAQLDALNAWWRDQVAARAAVERGEAPP